MFLCVIRQASESVMRCENLLPARASRFEPRHPMIISIPAAARGHLTGWFIVRTERAVCFACPPLTVTKRTCDVPVSVRRLSAA